MAKRVFKKAKKRIARMSVLGSLKINNAALRETIRQLQAEKETLSLALQSIAELYPRDPSGPGVCLAYLPREGQYYASLLRYDGAMGQGKQVLLSVKEETLEAAITELVTGWVSRTQATQTLRKRAAADGRISDGGKDKGSGNFGDW